MKQTADFFVQAQDCLEKVCRDYRPKLLEAHGLAQADLKADLSVVTDLDKELEQLLRDALIKLDPSIGIEGEELGKEGKTETFWLVDPIDGTENFIRGLPFVFNAATLIDNGEPVFAFVYRAVTDELFIAKKDGGAYKNGQALRVSLRPTNRAFIEISSSYLSDPEVVSLLSAIEPSINRMRKIDDFTYAVEGKVEGHLVYKSGGKSWDYAPRALLISEAGGKVANLGSERYDYRNYNLLAAAPHIFDDLMPLINKAVKL